MMAVGLENLENLKEYLFQLRYDLCKTEKSKEWPKQDLDKALKALKNNKARDAHGHIYEIFKYGGRDLKISLLKMYNRIKDSQIYPDICKPSNITILVQEERRKV